jgi:predicted dehydrogenase
MSVRRVKHAENVVRTAEVLCTASNSSTTTSHINRKSGLKMGVIGCGYWGSKHLRILNSLPEVAEVLIIEPDRNIRENAAAAFPLARAFPDLDAALPNADAFIVATPTITHFAVALKCLRHRKHVLLEKPMARSLEEACVLFDEARASNVTLMVGHTFEFNTAVRELKRRIVPGELGRVHYIHSARRNLGPYRSDVNVVWDLAPHDISIMNYLLGSFPSAVSAWGATNARPGTEDLAYIRIEYRDLGVTGFVHVSWLDPHKVREVVVVGSKKMAVYDDLLDEHLRIYDRGVEWREQPDTSFERPLTYRYGDIVSPYIQYEEPLLVEVRHFIECMRTGTAPQTDGQSGLAVVAVLEAIDQAVATGRVVEVRYPTSPSAPNTRTTPIAIPAKGTDHDHPLSRSAQHTFRAST